MPFLTPTVISATTSAGNGFLLLGPSWPQMVAAVVNTVGGYITAVPKVVSASAGAAGSGSGTGAIINSLPPLLYASFIKSFANNSLFGSKALDVAMSFAIGLSGGVAAMKATTTVGGVAVGAGSGNILTPGESAVLTPLMLSQLAAAGIAGADNIKVAKAVSEGFVEFLKLLKIVETVTGTPTTPPAPGVGVGTGALS